MREKLLQLKNEAIPQILEAQNAEELEELRRLYLGRKGKLTLLIKAVPKISPEQRTEIGQLANQIKEALEESIKDQKRKLAQKGIDRDKEWLDVTVPGEKPRLGSLHLISWAIAEIASIFEKIGFTRVRYPEVETDWYAFSGLNMPEGHPARDDWETFFIKGSDKKIVLTPHTSSGQLREMARRKPPIRMINIAKCYRRQSDVSHVPMFYQFEGLLIDQGVSLVHLKGVIDYFIRQFFGRERKSRFRPFHFRFTEPSLEVDVSCDVCAGTGKLADGSSCRLCKQGWLELGGAGLVHPKVLQNGKLDPRHYSGFAFGWGVERTFMMKQGLKIDDIRLLYTNDIRFLKQF